MVLQTESTSSSSSSTTTTTAISPCEEKKRLVSTEKKSSFTVPINGKQAVALVLFSTTAFVLWDAIFTPPNERIIRPESSAEFLNWVQANPYWGIGAFLIVFALCVVFMIPVGTPLTLGCGYIYKGTYGWVVGVGVATVVSMLGSALGAVLCFLLGRYLMRDRVRQLIRRYPLFDAIDVAVGEHGLRIMAMLYLTPVLPLGPVSYMCGSTSMALSSFVIAKIASLPLMMLYVFIGASAGTLIADTEAIESNTMLVLSGIVLSIVMIAAISHYIRKELMQILDRQKQTSEDMTTNTISHRDEDGLELGVQPSKSVALQRRHTTSNTAMINEDMD